MTVTFRRFVQFALLFVSCVAPAVAQTQGSVAAPPPELRQIFESALAECRAEGGRFVADPGGFYEIADFNGDGRDDYLVSPSALYCSAFGYSQHCGSAGCTQIVLISEGNRLRQVFANNIQAHALVTLPNGRQGLATGMHGSACGRAGADTCHVAMSWNGRAWTTSRLDREPPELVARIEAENAPPPLPRWEAIPGVPATGPGALLQDHPQLPIILIRCIEGTPVIQVRLGANGRGGELPAPPAGRSLTLRLGDDGDYGPGLQLLALEPIAAPREYIGAIPRAAFALLAGQGEMLSLEISGPDSRYWLPADALSLGGSSAALRPIAAMCGTGI